jgi:hypothetical protein
MPLVGYFDVSPHESKKLCAFVGNGFVAWRIYAPKMRKSCMKKVLIFLMFVLVVASCSPKPYYLTREGKKKTKYYNDVFYGRHKQQSFK